MYLSGVILSGRLDLGLDQMVAMDCAGHGNFGKAGADELEHRHLGCGILKDVKGLQIFIVIQLNQNIDSVA